jgi:hypothetical protein
LFFEIGRRAPRRRPVVDRSRGLVSPRHGNPSEPFRGHRVLSRLQRGRNRRIRSPASATARSSHLLFLERSYP